MSENVEMLNNLSDQAGETLTSEVLGVTREDFTAGSNTVIESSGMAKFGRSKSCTWYTAGKQMSTVTVTNKGSKELSVSIYGAPDTVKTTTDQALNSPTWSIPKGQRIVAQGDFEGRTVTFFNISAGSTDCEVMAKTRT
jgi:hypothetical protein